VQFAPAGGRSNPRSWLWTLTRLRLRGAATDGGTGPRDAGQDRRGSRCRPSRRRYSGRRGCCCRSRCSCQPGSRPRCGPRSRPTSVGSPTLLEHVSPKNFLRTNLQGTEGGWEKLPEGVVVPQREQVRTGVINTYVQWRGDAHVMDQHIKLDRPPRPAWICRKPSSPRTAPFSIRMGRARSTCRAASTTRATSSNLD